MTDASLAAHAAMNDAYGQSGQICCTNQAYLFQKTQHNACQGAPRGTNNADAASMKRMISPLVSTP